MSLHVFNSVLHIFFVQFHLYKSSTWLSNLDLTPKRAWKGNRERSAQYITRPGVCNGSCSMRSGEEAQKFFSPRKPEKSHKMRMKAPWRTISDSLTRSLVCLFVLAEVFFQFQFSGNFSCPLFSQPIQPYNYLISREVCILRGKFSQLLARETRECAERLAGKWRERN